MKAAGIKSAAELSRATGVNAVTLRAYLANERNPPLDVAERIGARLGVSGRFIFDGSKRRRPTTAPHQAPLIGYVAAGSSAVLYADGQGPFDTVDAPEGSTGNTVAVEIRGTSLGPALDRWLVFYDQVEDPPHEGLAGKLCVVGLPDGRVLVKMLQMARSNGLWHLHSNYADPPLLDQEVLWAAPVRSMAPRG